MQKTFSIFLLLVLCTLQIGVFVYGEVPDAQPSGGFILPSESLPQGIISPGNGKVYVALNWFGALAEIDTSNLTYSIYYIWSGGENHEIKPYTLAMAPNQKIYITERESDQHPWGDEVGRRIAIFDTVTKTMTQTEKTLGSMSYGIIYYEGYIWFANPPYLGRLNITDNSFSYYSLDYGIRMLAGDTPSIWITNSLEGKVIMFDTVSQQALTVISNLDRPLGIKNDGTYLYIAENSRNVGAYGSIIKYKKSTGVKSTISTAIITNEGPYEVFLDSWNNLWWTDNSEHYGYFTTSVSNTFQNGYFNYFLTQVGTSSIWISGVGSAVVTVKGIDLLGDVNKDFLVDISDLANIGRNYGKNSASEFWKPALDLNGDLKITIMDLAICGVNFGKKI